MKQVETLLRVESDKLGGSVELSTAAMRIAGDHFK